MLSQTTFVFVVVVAAAVVVVVFFPEKVRNLGLEQLWAGKAF